MKVIDDLTTKYIPILHKKRDTVGEAHRKESNTAAGELPLQGSKSAVGETYQVAVLQDGNAVGETWKDSNDIIGENRQLTVQRRELADSRQKVIIPGIKKKLIKGGTASLLGLSITVAGLFGTPEELIRQQTINQLHDTAAVELVIDDEDPGSEEDNRKKAETSPAKKGFFTRISESAKRAILKVPVAVRALVGLPLWAAGYAILHLLSGLYSVVLAPVISHIIGFVLLALILLAVFTLTMKTIFPNMPLKKILRKKNIIRVLIGAAVLKVVDLVLPLFWPEYTRFKYLIMLGAGLIVLAVLIVPRILRWRRHRRRPATT